MKDVVFLDVSPSAPSPAVIMDMDNVIHTSEMFLGDAVRAWVMMQDVGCATVSRAAVAFNVSSVVIEDIALGHPFLALDKYGDILSEVVSPSHEGQQGWGVA